MYFNFVSILTILCILNIKRFNYIYQNEQNVYWQAGLHTFYVINSPKTASRRPNMWEFMYVMCVVLGGAFVE